MLKDLTLFMDSLNQYVQNYPGPVQEGFHFHHRMEEPFDWKSYPSHLMAHFKAGTYLFHMYQPTEYLYILLEGQCCTEKYKSSGDIFTDNTRYPLQMFGLFEALVGSNYHSVTMKALTDCVCAKIPIDTYLVYIRSRPDFMWMTMKFMASFMTDYFEIYDYMLLHNPKFNVLSKLYRYCIGKSFPVTIPFKKEDLARDLNLNLRTLYRYLDQMYEDGYLSSSKGKIMITAQQHQKIGELLSTE